MTVTTHRPHVPPSAADEAYVRAGFVSFARLCAWHGLDEGAAAREVEAGRLPRPSYVLADGTPMYPREAFDAPGRDEFVVRWRAAGGDGDADAEYRAMLSGEYGLCLRQVTPETIAIKERLVARLERALADPRPDDPAWRTALRDDIAALDALERPFAECDRARFGGPVSRDRLITAPRARYPWL
jgi:hypothetical protein